MSMATRHLLSVGHSYVVSLNRRLAEELARAGGPRGWSVTAVAPSFVHGDLRPIPLEDSPRTAEMGLTVEAVPFHLSSRIHLAFYGPRLLSVLGRRRWSLLHVWEEPYVTAGGQAALLCPHGTPMVFWTAQNLAKSYPPPFGWLERFCLARCAGWLACGHTIVDTLSPRGYAARPHRVMPLGVDTVIFRPDPAARSAVRQRLGWSSDGPPVVGYLGRFVPEKGLDTLTTGLSALPPSTAWRALLVGGGPMEPMLREWAALHGDRVRIITGVPHDRVPEHLAAMDVLAAPSRTTPFWREQLGRMILEAFAVGVAVVGSDSGEIPYTIGAAGVVVREADAAGWTQVLGELLESPARRAELAAAGRDRAVSEFAWPVLATRHLDFFEELTETRR